MLVYPQIIKITKQFLIPKASVIVSLNPVDGFRGIHAPFSLFSWSGRIKKEKQMIHAYCLHLYRTKKQRRGSCLENLTNRKKISFSPFKTTEHTFLVYCICRRPHPPEFDVHIADRDRCAKLKTIAAESNMFWFHYS